MRTTLEIDSEVVEAAMAAVAAPTKTAAVRMGLEALVEQAARKRLAALFGRIPEIKAVLADLDRFPEAPVVTDEEIRQLSVDRQLSGRGIGWVDVQLLASALLANAQIWTFDPGLESVAREMKLAAEI